MTKKRIGIIFGGKSQEHDISIKSAFSVMQAMDYSHASVFPIYITQSGDWLFKQPLTASPVTFEQLADRGEEVVSITHFLQQEIDVAFPILHGPNGEDGSIQGLLEFLNIPYVGCNIPGSAIGIDKVLFKKMMDASGIPQCNYTYFLKDDILENTAAAVSAIQLKLGYPCFVKPANLGSSVGISKANNEAELKHALLLACEYDTKILIEEFVAARELEVGILGNKNLLASVVGEIATSSTFYDYEAKYQNEQATTLHIPALISEELEEAIKSLGKKVFQEINGCGLARVDFFWDEKSDRLFVNEVNTMPGFTAFSMYPKLFEKAGIGYAQLIDTLIQLAEEKHMEKQMLRFSFQ